MNKVYTFFLLLILCCGTANSQTIDELKTLFENQQYGEALPQLKKMIKMQPANANLNYWYGESLCKTGNPEMAVKYLEIASKRGVSAANLSLGRACEALYQFDKAAVYYNNYRRTLLQQKRATDEVDRDIIHCKMGLNMLQGVEKVCVIDSFVVDKKNFLSAYKLSHESGSLYYFKDYFKSDSISTSTTTTVYENERQNRILYGGASKDGSIKLFSRIKTTDEGWSTPTALPDVVNETDHVNYPFLLDDGVTLYFAADGKNSLGGYDIFVTRYDTNTDSYLKPDNIGMPFNSPFNDYMLAIDTYHNIGWFASDRYQPTSKVCIYVFVPNAAKVVYDIKAVAPNKLIGLAKLNAIQSTWADSDKLNASRKELDKILSRKSVAQRKGDSNYAFTFVVNDSHIYHEYTDFKSEEALESFKKWEEEQNKFEQNKKRLETLRVQYAQSDSTLRKNMSSTILLLERQQLEKEPILEKQTLLIRKLEMMKLER